MSGRNRSKSSQRGQSGKGWKKAATKRKINDTSDVWKAKMDKVTVSLTTDPRIEELVIAHI